MRGGRKKNIDKKWSYRRYNFVSVQKVETILPTYVPLTSVPNQHLLDEEKVG